MMKAPETVIGVTGALASGKSTVARLFAGKGAYLIDADRISHRILEGDPGVKDAVIRRFGRDILSGRSIDRRKLGEKVFSSGEELRFLCGQLHPLIIREIRSLVEGCGDPCVVIDAPLLLETGLDAMVDIVVLVRAPLEVMLERAGERGIGRKMALRIIDSQMPLKEKEKRADHIIDTDKGMDETKKGVEEIWKASRRKQ